MDGQFQDMLIHCQKMPSPAQFSQTTEEWHQLRHEQHLLHISDFQIRPSVMAKPHTTYCTKLPIAVSKLCIYTENASSQVEGEGILSQILVVGKEVSECQDSESNLFSDAVNQVGKPSRGQSKQECTPHIE